MSDQNSMGLGSIGKFHEYINTSKSHEKLYMRVLRHDEHKSGLGFQIIDIINPI